ncbi:hypothetical protein N658DRAFT_556054 [Parathielavia hyrcaniae]|uniref:Uncharacterized protein n=1 Tax=Parathielavia hyrcaniae TaxID=113614 RepID=A0AAN6T697_9PEZI|nr:hypothetical protein N658DRAFT_556054 [Parathielavia hyrcaniae]
MLHTAVLPLFSSILLLAGLGAAVPVASSEGRCESRIICVDAINRCGIRYGGCYDICDVTAKPVAPPCPTSTRKPTPSTTKKLPVTSTTKPTVTSTKKSSTLTTLTKRPSSSSTTRACTATAPWLCWDGINECGMMYGGCFPDCKPWPTFTPPPCPTGDKPTMISKVTTLPTLTVPHYG